MFLKKIENQLPVLPGKIGKQTYKKPSLKKTSTSKKVSSFGKTSESGSYVQSKYVSIVDELQRELVMTSKLTLKAH